MEECRFVLLGEPAAGCGFKLHVARRLLDRAGDPPSVTGCSYEEHADGPVEPARTWYRHSLCTVFLLAMGGGRILRRLEAMLGEKKK